MYEMLRHEHPVSGALSIIIRKRIVAMMIRGTKCYTLLQYLQRWAFIVIIIGDIFLPIIVIAQNSLDLSITNIAFVIYFVIASKLLR